MNHSTAVGAMTLPSADTWLCVSSREVQMVAQRAPLGGGGRISPSGRKHSSRLWCAGASSCRQPRRMPAGKDSKTRSQLKRIQTTTPHHRLTHRHSVMAWVV